MPQLSLGPREAHLWLLSPERFSSPAMLDVYLSWLLPDEHARRDRYLFERNKTEYLLTRALVKSTLSLYADVAPDAWRFTANSYGCPAVANEGLGWLRFNLTNTEGLIALLVARDVDVGVDVESVGRKGETTAVADRFFSPEETRRLRALAPELQRERFFDYWTLKEAYIKARGMGLAIPLDQFTFLFDGVDDPVTIECDPRLNDDPALWQFNRFKPTERHKLATAIKRPEPTVDYDIRLREFLP